MEQLDRPEPSASDQGEQQGWLSRTEAAALFRVTEQTIDDLVRDNLIPYRRRGHSVLLPREALLAALRYLPGRGGR